MAGRCELMIDDGLIISRSRDVTFFDESCRAFEVHSRPVKLRFRHADICILLRIKTLAFLHPDLRHCLIDCGLRLIDSELRVSLIDLSNHLALRDKAPKINRDARKLTGDLS